MPNLFGKEKRTRRGGWLLAADSYIDSTLYELTHGSGYKWERFSNFMRRFSAEGYKRWIVELTSETATLGVAGAMLMLALALPAFEETKKDWLAQDEYSVTFLDRYGNEIGTRGIRHDDAFTLDELPDHSIQAVLATEDRRFFTHFGIDAFGTLRAIVENARAGGVVQGGSSLTQQLAKNLFLSNERTLERKIKEAFLALWLEANLTKPEILKLYLDRAYMGGGNFGIAAAADFYFGKSVQDLTLAESAMLAGLFKAPTKYAPHINLPAARARANEVLVNMVQAGFMTEGQILGAQRAPATPVEREQQQAPDYFLDHAFQEVKDFVRGEERVLTVRTTVDTGLQAAADRAIETSLREEGERYRVKQAGLVSLEPDGAIRAMVGGRDYGVSAFNRATLAKRQPGSSFKPFVYALALENGYTPKSVISDSPICIGDWCPRNYGRDYRGRVTLKTALARSINTVPVRLSAALGRQPIVDLAYRMGVTTSLEPVPRSLALGPKEMTVMDMAAAYAVFANGGYRVEPYSFTRIVSSEGEVIYDRFRDAPPREKVLSDATVAGMVEMLNAVVTAGTGRRAALSGIPAAGKTGTTQSYVDAWFVGFTGNYSTAVWFGNDENTQTNDLTGGRLPAQTWQKYMRVAHINTPLVALPGLPIEEAPTLATDEGEDFLADASSAPQLLPDETASRLRGLEDRLRAVSGTIEGQRQATLDEPAIGLEPVDAALR